jgi:FlgD Ig-like domain
MADAHAETFMTATSRPWIPVALFSMALLAFPAIASTDGHSHDGNDELDGLTWKFVPSCPCVDQIVHMKFEARGPSAQILSAETIDSHHVRLVVKVTGGHDDDQAVQVAGGHHEDDNSDGGHSQCKITTAEVELGTLPAGLNHVDLETIVRKGKSEHANNEHTIHLTASVTVRDSCGTQPPPSGSVPFLQSVTIGPPPICPADSIHVVLEGQFPNPAFHVRDVLLLPSLARSGFPLPPTVHLVVDHGACTDSTPPDSVVHWVEEVVLPPLAMPQNYQLNVEMAQVNCADSLDSGPLPHASFPFAVTNCRDTSACAFVVSWRGPDSMPGACDALFGGDSANVVMRLRSVTPLAALQGRIHLSSHAFQVGALTPVGPASGMNLTWAPDSSGATFVLFAKDSAYVPAHLPTSTQPGDSVLRVTVTARDTAVALPGFVQVSALDLLGSDADGIGLAECRGDTLNLNAARICVGSDVCDADGNGITDVRDLVRLIRCIQKPSACPDSGRSFDCNRDGKSDLDDVLCCAMRILQGELPDSTHARSEPSVAVMLGVPDEGPNGIRLPITITDEARVGAARLVLSVPSDRYDVRVEMDAADAPSWLELHDVSAGRLTLGLVGLAGSGATSAPRQDVHATLVFTLRPGAQPGGGVLIERGELAGPDGAALRGTIDATNVPLGTELAKTLSLSAAMPNPFGRETRFSVTLSKAGAVELTVHDLSGRRVATLHHGAMQPGTSTFIWRGERDDGSRVADGVYFVRLGLDGHTVARKVALLHNN